MTKERTVVMLDVGMTLIHPSGQVMAQELAACGAGHIPTAVAAAALAAAAEAHHMRFPSELTRPERVGVVWAALLGLPASIGRRAWPAAARRPDLYADLDPDAVDVLTTLRARGVPIAAVSNSDGTLLEELTAFGIAEFFDVAVDSTVVRSEKPDHGIFHAALRKLECRPEQVWFVGDGLINDMFGAAAAGIENLVLYDRHHIHHAALPVTRIHRLTELPGLLETIQCESA
ncbi:HAD-IA family hydrolase [Nocardia uniformis]|uniref:HAD-IA family hydrolase n=1 Tax=Nocardia uniformis TaxID=53432 RepID=A0A849CBN5_9NOCA|nr:HAD-IA family hydrolase [Nocardia uniformis]NNH76044.1 HAD-IA family hydrolase [Nocardia uniformis]